jgi:hypothetical protein
VLPYKSPCPCSYSCRGRGLASKDNNIMHVLKLIQILLRSTMWMVVKDIPSAWVHSILVWFQLAVTLSMVRPDTSGPGELDVLEKWITVWLTVIGGSTLSSESSIILIPSSPWSKCSGVSDILTVHCRAEPFVQQESVRWSPGHTGTLDTDDDSKHTN